MLGTCLKDYVHMYMNVYVLYVLVVQVLKSSLQIQDINFQGGSVHSQGVIIAKVCPQVLRFQVLSHSVQLWNAQTIVIYLYAFPQRSHLNVFSTVSCSAQVLCSAQAGNWWKWEFLREAQIINGRFLVP